VNAYLRAYIVHARHPADAFYSWRLWDTRQFVRVRWGW
jgi:hypothetical protein